ncbi:hypothetical protein [Planococcus ruber]|uniref:hypothetical protein n=1 Tax=Planococcus ruber TaxID=2027871 RepID=UPI001FEE1687|nr:hypothetical protein [Planococcus ruber]MCJ1910058.1 hypothetical protein [Planococcus ruber]
MTRKGTAGRTPEQHNGAPDSAIDQVIKKTKEVFDGENDAVNYDDLKGQDEKEAAKEYSKKVADDPSTDSHRD